MRECCKAGRFENFFEKEVDEVVKASHNFLLPTADCFAAGDELKSAVLTV